MLTQPTLSNAEIVTLRQAHYNAELVEVIPMHEDLRILRVRPDEGVRPFQPGQYTVLGLGLWEPRFEDIPDEPHDETQLRSVCKRAYSISCPLLDPLGRLLPVERATFVEFYVVLIREAEKDPPAFTPRLFALDTGDRLLFGPKLVGKYTLGKIGPEDDCIFLATGTGEAPHNAMIANLLDSGHRGRIVHVTCVRNRNDLGYLRKHLALQESFRNYRYLWLTTREPENVDPTVSGFVGKRYLQDYFETGEFDRDAGLTLDPSRMHVFLCGNPAMIGAPRRSPEGTCSYPQPKGMVEVLERCGFHADLQRQPGNIHFEKYW